MKLEWELQTYWNFGLAIKIPSWKYYPTHLYLTRHIVMSRMRPDMKLGHIIMYNNEPKAMQA